MNLNEIQITILLQDKDNSVYCTTVNSTVADAVEEMNRLRIGCLMVTDSGYVVGIFTERDILIRIVAADLNPKSTRVGEVMTARFQSISYDASVEDAMQMIKKHRIRHLPVFDGQQLVGMLSVRDINSWLLKVNEIEAENLRRYMFEGYPC